MGQAFGLSRIFVVGPWEHDRQSCGTRGIQAVRGVGLLRVSALLALLPLLGCFGGSSGPPRVTIQGTVLYDGKPVEDGEIAFHPAEGSNAPPTSTVIKEGSYEVGGRFGIAPGTYRVEIKSFREAPPAPSPDGIERPTGSGFETREQLLPAKFNSASEIEPIVVPPDEDPVFQDFDLRM